MDENLKFQLTQMVLAIWLFMVGAVFAEMLNELFFGTGNVIIRMVTSLVLMFLFSGAIWLIDYVGMINGAFGCALAVAGGALWTVYAIRTNQIL